MHVIKLKRSPDASTILEFFDALPSWENLSSKISNVFNIPLTNVGAAYVHKDRESVTLTNDQGLQQYFSDQSCQEFKFVVQDTHKPDCESGSSLCLISATHSYPPSCNYNRFNLVSGFKSVRSIQHQ